MSHKRPLDVAVPPEQHEEAEARSPRKRLRRTVLVAVCFARICAPGRRRARAATLEQMVRQAQLDMAKLFFLLMVLVARLSSMESLLLDLPNLIQRSVMGSIEDTIRSAVQTEIQGLAEQFATLQRSVTGSIQDPVRSVLRTEMEEPQAALLPNGVHEPSREILEGLPETVGSSGVVKLRFIDADRPKDPLYTGCPVQWQNGENAKVAIFRNGKKIMDGDLSKLQIEILPVYADFCTERGLDSFTKEEFNKHIYISKGKESVLTTVNLTNGEAYLDSFFFKESSYNTNLRLAARVKWQDLADRVQEAITDPFVVKDRRSESNEKSDRPSKGDAVHRLKKISQKGKYCIALAEKNITIVKHLMRQYNKDKSGLQKLTGMRKGDWSTMIKHATMCDPGDEIYSYRVAQENCELLFNDLYEFVGAIINGSYIPVRDLDQLQQLKVNSWKMSAYKKFDERENSGVLTPDYLMSDGCPVLGVPLNNDAGPSVQARMACQYPNDMAAQHEFGEEHSFRQQNVFLPVEVLSNTDAGPSKHTEHQDLGEHVPTMPQNGIPKCHLVQGNILNGHGSLSAQTTIPSYNLPPVPQDDLITDASLTGQQNGSLSSWATDTPGASYPVTDGVREGTSSIDHVDAYSFSGFFNDELLAADEAHGADQDFIPANNAELPNPDNQFHGYGHNNGNW